MALSLSSLSKERSIAAPRLVVHGQKGLGKTTFACGAPDPVILLAEDGMGLNTPTHYKDENGRPVVLNSYEQLIEQLQPLLNEDHSYKTLILDSLDCIEPLVWNYTCRLHGQPNIDMNKGDFAFQRGYLAAEAVWRELVQWLDAIRTAKNMSIILLAHTDVKRFESPIVEGYDRYVLALHKKAIALIEHWADAILFANYEIFTSESEGGFNQKITRGITTGKRFLHTNETPAYTAKNRYNLPDKIPLTWDEFSAAMAASHTNQNTGT